MLQCHKLSTNDLHIPPDGYIILPVSMSRSNNSQSAAVCYEILKECQQKCQDVTTIDVIILYTTSLYYNTTSETAWDAKKRLSSQMISHKAALQKLVSHSQELQLAVHFRTWEETMLAAPDYQHFYQKLRRHVETHTDLYELAVYSIGNREANDASLSFLIEETVIAHILRQKRVPLPKSHVKEDNFRLIVYPGPYIAIDLYQWKQKILPQRTAIPFGDSQYNVATKELYTFDTMSLPAGNEWRRELRIA